MKLSLVTETFPPEINGVAMTLANVCAGLSALGHNVTVIRPRPAGTPAAATPTAYQEHRVPGFPLPGYALLRFGLPIVHRLKARWQQERPDLVHIATEGPLGLGALRAARALGLPVTSSFHTNFHAYAAHYGVPMLGGAVLRYLRWFHNRTTLTLTPSPSLNAELTRAGFRGVRLMSRGVDTATFHPSRRSTALRRQWGARDPDLVVLHVSRLAAEKNYPAVFAAFARIRTVRPDARLVIVSDGPLRRRLERTAPSGTVFTGFLERHDLAQAYASADLFVYASLTETFGNVVTEAAASGLPLVTYRYAAAEHYLQHLDSAWLAPLGEEHALLEGAVALAQDASLRQRLAVRARQVAETIPWSEVIAALERDLTSVAFPSGVPVARPAGALRS